MICMWVFSTMTDMIQTMETYHRHDLQWNIYIYIWICISWEIWWYRYRSNIYIYDTSCRYLPEYPIDTVYIYIYMCIYIYIERERETCIYIYRDMIWIIQYIPIDICPIYHISYIYIYTVDIDIVGDIMIPWQVPTISMAWVQPWQVQPCRERELGQSPWRSFWWENHLWNGRVFHMSLYLMQKIRIYRDPFQHLDSSSRIHEFQHFMNFH